MKIPVTKLLLLFCLALSSTLAVADSRYEPRYNDSVIGSGSWRLGSFRGGIRGYEILYRAPGRNRWQLAPGTAMAIGDGWVLGTDRHNGGYGIYRWNGYGWNRMPGTAVEIGGSYQRPWVVNDRGIRYDWNGYDWRQSVRASRDNRNGRDNLWDDRSNSFNHNPHNDARDDRAFGQPGRPRNQRGDRRNDIRDDVRKHGRNN